MGPRHRTREEGGNNIDTCRVIEKKARMIDSYEV